ncbi:MAG TPA: hypothetical protein VG692_03645, partial [Gemmatimonadales bacterium]|nr:hypothetical protein [Gemmatimonadales bacterium]
APRSAAYAGSLDSTTSLQTYMRHLATSLALALATIPSLAAQTCPPPASISSAIRMSDYVFVGRVLEVTKDSIYMSFGAPRPWYSPARKVTFKVVRQWLGRIKDTIQLRTDPMDSAYTAKVGRFPLLLTPNTEYLVFASGSSTLVSGNDTIHYRDLVDEQWTNDCMGTRLTTVARPWLRLLNRDPIEILEVDSLVRD